MKDRIGNTIHEDEVVQWDIPLDMVKRILFTVVRVQDGGIATPSGDSDGLIQLTIYVPVTRSNPGEPILTDFLCVKNPNNEKLLNALTSSVKQ